MDFYKINSNFEGINLFKKPFYGLSFIKVFVYVFKLKGICVFKRSTIMMIVQFFFFCFFKILNKKIILHLHGSEYLFFETLFQKKLFRANIALSSVLIVLHESFAEDLEKYVNDIRVVENFSDLTIGKKKQTTSINFTFLSNLLKEKGILELVSAFTRLQKKYKNIYLNVYGKDIDGLKDSINGDNVNYYGEIIDEEKKKECLALCDVICLPTYYKTEAFPISIIEGLMMKCHIITTNFNYLYQIFRFDQVAFVEPRSVDQLEKSMESYILNRNKISVAIEEKYPQSFNRYSKNNFLKKMKKVLSEK